VKPGKYAVLVPVGVVLWYVLDHIFSMAFVAAMQDWGWVKYPLYMVPGLLLALVVMMSKKLEDVLEKASQRFKSRFWINLRSKGAIPFVFVATFVWGPAAGALAARLMRLSDRRAWVYILGSATVSCVIKVLFYGNLFEGLKTYMERFIHLLT
jgi:hypothetical protein